MRFTPSVLRAALGCAMLADTLFVGVVNADPYLDNITGNVIVSYAHKNATTGAYDITRAPISPPSIKQTFDDQWSTVSSNLCPALKAAINPTKWSTCDLGTAGDLQGQQPGSNALAFKYVVRNNHLNFDLPTASPLPDATFDVYFDAEFDLSLSFDQVLTGELWNGDPNYRGTPTHIQAATLHLQNVQIHTANLIAAAYNFITGAIGSEEAALDGKSADATKQISGHIGDLNGQFHDGATQLAAYIRTSDPASNAFFNLDVSMDPTGNVIVQYRRDFDPPSAPLNVNVRNSFPQGNLVTWSSSATTARPVDHYEVQRMDYVWQGGEWVVGGSTTGTRLMDHPPFLPQDGTVSFAYTVSAVNIYGRATSAQWGSPGSFPSSPPGGAPPRRCNPCQQ